MTKRATIKIDQTRCDFCGTCVAVCPEDAILLGETQIVVNGQRCSLCLNCVDVCPFGIPEAVR